MLAARRGCILHVVKTLVEPMNRYASISCVTEGRFGDRLIHFFLLTLLDPVVPIVVFVYMDDALLPIVLVIIR